VATAGVILGSLSLFLGIVRPGIPQEEPPGQTRPVQEPTIADIVARAEPAVVSITVERDPRSGIEKFLDRLLGHPANALQRSLGSGVLVRQDGIIVTNAHVVTGAEHLDILLADQRRFRACLIGMDLPSDLAVLKIPGEGLPVLPFGDSSATRLGETVLAIGNPLGLGSTISRGVLSARGRIEMDGTYDQTFLQTDAAINPGNSGGALITLRGELIGINTATASRLSGSLEGPGYVIPSTLVHEIMEILLTKGTVTRGFLGVAVEVMTPRVAEDVKITVGVVVVQVEKGSPAQEAGLKEGDVLEKANGKTIQSPSQLQNGIALLGPGANVIFEVRNRQTSREVLIRLK
jgi:S1-C subfamily serine protease